MQIKNAWYVAGWASEVAADDLLSRTFLNVEVILYRDGEGSVVAMEDRCCHRHAPLSKGRLEGDAVRCMYHGLKFAPNGLCIEIPGEKKLPPRMKVRCFPVVEQQNLIWIWLGDPALANSTVYSTDGQLRALDCLPEWLGTIVNYELFYERFNFIYLQNYRGKTAHIASQHASFM